MARGCKGGSHAERAHPAEDGKEGCLQPDPVRWKPCPTRLEERPKVARGCMFFYMLMHNQSHKSFMWRVM